MGNALAENILKYLIENDTLTLSTICTEIEMKEKEKYLAMHQYKIWKGNDGNYHTQVYDESKKNKRKAIKRKSLKSLESAICNYYEKENKEPYLKEVFYQWIERKLKYGEIEKQTANRYETEFLRFFVTEEICQKRVSEITENDLEEFIKKTICENELTAKGWGNLRIIINGIFRYAKKEGYTQLSISQFIGDLELPKRLFKKSNFSDEDSVFTDSEFHKIKAYIDAVEPSIINLGILLAFQAGLRAGELAALKYNDLKGNVLSVNKTEIRYKDENGRYVFEVRGFTKGAIGHRKVILNSLGIETMKRAKMMNPFGEYLFMENGQRIKGKAFTVKIEKICKYVGIKPRSLHKVRKTYGTKLLNAGVNEKIIESQMGHNDISTTKGFYWFNNFEEKELQDVVARALKY